MVDVNVEAPATIFSQRIGEFFVCLAESAVLGVLHRLAIVIALPGPTVSAAGECWIEGVTHSDRGSRFSYPSSGDGYEKAHWSVMVGV